MRALIRKYARIHDIPESLLHRVIQRESDYNPAARNGPYYGLMQILPQTARTMGYRGAPSGLLDAETNLMYAGRYLRGAWLVSHGSESRAVMWYAKGYYYEAKRRACWRKPACAHRSGQAIDIALFSPHCTRATQYQASFIPAFLRAT